MALAVASPALAGSTTELPRTLRDTGLYADWATKRVADGVLPFSPQYPLWTDGASKRRWIRLPPGSAIDARNPDLWDFPVGTRLWKEFSFGKRVETRYLERRRSGWVYATYLWSADETAAPLAPDQGVPDVPVRPGQAHTIPSRLDCRACHEGTPSTVLGFSALQLSTDRDPGALHAEPPQPGSLDLSRLLELGLLRHYPAALAAHPPRIAARTEVERAALGYLHGNCSACHNAAGPLASVGLDLQHPVAIISPTNEPGVRTTVAVPSTYQIPGVPAAEGARVKPGEPARSALLHRMSSRHALAQMPPLGTRVPDAEAVQLVRRWIDELGQNGTRTLSSNNNNAQPRSRP